MVSRPYSRYRYTRMRWKLFGRSRTIIIIIIINGKRYFAWRARARALHSFIVSLPRNSIFSISSSSTSSTTRFVLRSIATTPTLCFGWLELLFQFVVLALTALPYFRSPTVSQSTYFFSFYFCFCFSFFLFLPAHAFSCSVCKWCSVFTPF